MFSCPNPPENSLRTFWWWEFRRIPFNLVIGLWGVLCLIATSWGVRVALTHGEDAVEPLALVLLPFIINALYSLGWLVEIPLRWMRPRTTLRLGPTLLALGFGTGMTLCSLPAIYWVGYRLLH